MFESLSTALGPLAESIGRYALAHPEQTIGLVFGTGGVGYNYAKTGKLPIGRLPYKHIREIIRELGDRYFARNRPRGVVCLVADTDPKTIKRALHERHYESSDLTSYEYEDELYNLRRPEGYATDPAHGGDVLMENHTRLFETNGGNTLLLTHYEPNRYAETTEHLANQGLSWENGRELIESDLESATITYREYQSETAADVTVVSA